jgi:hypothetical protein
VIANIGMKNVINLSILFLVLNHFPGISQTKFTDNLQATGYYHFGYVLPEYSNFLYVVNKPVQGFSLNLSRKTRGKNDWEQIYNYPEYGISLFYSTLGNNRIHGKEFAINPYFRMNIISRNRFNFFNETALGLGYVTKIFDEKNYLNIAVGSHLNLHFALKFGVHYRIGDKLHLNAGIGFDHFSNANSRNPNLGINWVTSFTGVSYALGAETAIQDHELTPHVRRFQYEFIYSFGGKKSRGVLQSDLYYTSSLTFEGKWNMTRAIRLGAGTDLFYDPSAKSEMAALDNFNYERSDDFRTGIHLSQEFVYSRLSLILQEGFYVGLTDAVNHNIMYNRGIVRFQLKNWMFVQLAMKSHLHVLDYPEFGLGIKW